MSTEQIHLPDEIILHILSYFPDERASQKELWKCSLLSRDWNRVANEALYRHPHIYGTNFTPFVRTIRPSINAHIRDSVLARKIRILDLGSLVHHSTRSITAGILYRVKTNLEVFVAPQSSFAINCVAALSKCTNLRKLDLSLISESIPFHSIAHIIAPLAKLQGFRFPRAVSGGQRDEAKKFDEECQAAFHLRWPPKLEAVHFSGVGSGFIEGTVRDPQRLPPTVFSVGFSHCQQLHPVSMSILFHIQGHQIRHLNLSYLPPAFAKPTQASFLLTTNSAPFADEVLRLLPNLRYLSISTDYISAEFPVKPQPDPISGAPPPAFPLQYFDITASARPPSPTDDDSFQPGDLALEIEEGTFPHLRRCRIAEQTGWFRSDVEDEMELLIEKFFEFDARNWAERRGPYRMHPSGKMEKPGEGGIYKFLGGVGEVTEDVKAIIMDEL